MHSGDQPGSFDMGSISPGTVKFSTLDGPRSGNIFEVFHYDVVTKGSEDLLARIYRRKPRADDIAIVFTDFRIDDLYGKGGGAIAANFGIKGIGSGAEKPRSTVAIGSTELQMSVATVWLGSPTFDASGTEDDGTHWFNFAHGVKWISHECTHRWGMDLSFQHSATKKDEKLTDSSGHWREDLDTTAVFPVWQLFLDKPGVGNSIMGGNAWRRNADGTFSSSTYPPGVPGGYSALDLYVIGMLPPSQVPRIGLIENKKDLGGNRFQGTLVPIQMDEVTNAMGPRVPTCANAQKIFHMTFYIVHPPGRDTDPRLLTRAEQLSAAVAKFFLTATGGAMKVTTTVQ